MRKVARECINEGTSYKDLAWCAIGFEAPHVWDYSLGMRILGEELNECCVIGRPDSDKMEYMSLSSHSPSLAHQARRFEGCSVICEEAENKVKNVLAELVRCEWLVQCIRLNHFAGELLEGQPKYHQG